MDNDHLTIAGTLTGNTTFMDNDHLTIADTLTGNTTSMDNDHLTIAHTLTGNTTSMDNKHLTIAGTLAGNIIFSIDMCLILPIVFGNIFIIAAYIRNSKLQLVSNLLILNLAVTDLTTGIISIPIVSFVRYGNYGLDKMKYPCLFRIICGHGPLAISILTLLSISLVRYIAVLHPLKCKLWITRYRLKLLICLLWITNMGLVAGYALIGNTWSSTQPVCDISVILPKSYSFIMGAYCLGVCVCSTLLYIFISRAVNKSKRFAQAMPQRMPSNYDARTTKMLITVLVCFYLCWMPSFMKILIGLIVYKGIPEPAWLNIFEQSALCVVFANSFMNPIIYAGMHDIFRQTFKEIWQSIFKHVNDTKTNMEPKTQQISISNEMCQM